jgi:hypothetical protein
VLGVYIYIHTFMLFICSCMPFLPDTSLYTHTYIHIHTHTSHGDVTVTCIRPAVALKKAGGGENPEESGGEASTDEKRFDGIAPFEGGGSGGGKGAVAALVFLGVGGGLCGFVCVCVCGWVGRCE